MTKKGLGKGIEALFPETREVDLKEGEKVVEVDINKLEPGNLQPRTLFDAEKLADLAESIKAHGIIQPITVKEEYGYYSIVMGERRWRAARIAGLTSVPVIIREYTDFEALEAALIENVQRADLNPVEEAECYSKLIGEYSFTQEELSSRVGKSRSHIANLLRILSLDYRLRDMVAEGSLSVGHAKALLPVADVNARRELAERIVGNGLSVRDAERLAASFLTKGADGKAAGDVPKAEGKPPEIRSAERSLESSLGTKVTIKNNKNKGKIEISYFSEEELDRLLLLLTKPAKGTV